MTHKVSRLDIQRSEDFNLIREKMFKNKDEIQEFYTKNKMKLPPILQSKNIFLKKINIQTIDNPEAHRVIQKTQRKIEMNTQTDHKQQPSRKKLTEAIPNVCKIIFQKDSSIKLRRDPLIRSSLSRFQKDSEVKTAKTINVMSKISDLIISKEEKQKEIVNFQTKSNQNANALEKLLNRINQSKSLKREESLSVVQNVVSLQLKDENKNKNSLNINKMQTYDLQRQLKNHISKGQKYESAEIEEIFRQRKLKKIERNKNRSQEKHIDLNSEIKHKNNSRKGDEKFISFGQFEPWQQSKQLQFF